MSTTSSSGEQAQFNVGTHRSRSHQGLPWTHLRRKHQESICEIALGVSGEAGPRGRVLTGRHLQPSCRPILPAWAATVPGQGSSPPARNIPGPSMMRVDGEAGHRLLGVVGLLCATSRLTYTHPIVIDPTEVAVSLHSTLLPMLRFPTFRRRERSGGTRGAPGASYIRRRGGNRRARCHADVRCLRAKAVRDAKIESVWTTAATETVRSSLYGVAGFYLRTCVVVGTLCLQVIE